MARQAQEPAPCKSHRVLTANAELPRPRGAAVVGGRRENHDVRRQLCEDICITAVVWGHLYYGIGMGASVLRQWHYAG